MSKEVVYLLSDEIEFEVKLIGPVRAVNRKSLTSNDIEESDTLTVTGFEHILDRATSGERIVFQDGFVLNDDQPDTSDLFPDLRSRSIDSPMTLVKSRKEKLADGMLIFACSSPDEADAAVGDLIEKFNQVAARQPKGISYLYFTWELILLFITKLRRRIVKSTIGPLIDKWFKNSTS